MKTVTIEYMRAVPKNTLLRLRYDCVNTGEFWWLHDRVEADRVYGAFSYDGEDWGGVCDYLYEFMGEVCRGSGAEPVMLVKRVDMAKDPDQYRAVLGTAARRPKGLQRGQALQLATVLALPKGSRIFFRQAVDGPVQCFEYWHAKGELEDTPYGCLLTSQEDRHGEPVTLISGPEGALLKGSPVLLETLQLPVIQTRIRALRRAASKARGSR